MGLLSDIEDVPMARISPLPVHSGDLSHDDPGAQWVGVTRVVRPLCALSVRIG